ncbi:MAG: cob(I)yrinic acid a,c-diamide adenosyltransferase [Capsulimonadaceae bacterium]|nr:cob(I)yrinic acid a,c-diamide adenosyltransferase [Capsulimonadaceae bacterium]
MNKNQQGLLIVYTGNGKGKTTAALGIAMRCWGRGMRVAMMQFIKKRELKSGEHLAARSMDGIEIVPLGDGFTWLSEDLNQDRSRAQDGWDQCVARLESSELDVVVLDELTYCLNFGWLAVDDVLDALARRRPGMHVVVTGRDAPQKLIERADLVTEMREIKHPYRRGVTPQKGIDL